MLEHANVNVSQRQPIRSCRERLLFHLAGSFHQGWMVLTERSTSIGPSNQEAWVTCIIGACGVHSDRVPAIFLDQPKLSQQLCGLPCPEMGRFGRIPGELGASLCY